MMKFMKRFFLVVFAFLMIFASVMFAKTNVKADSQTSSEITYVGTQVRKTDPTGIRFVSKVNLSAMGLTKDDVSVYGTLVGFGSGSANLLTVDAASFNGKSIVNIEASALADEENGYFYGSITGFTEVLYAQGLTARAYILKTNGDYIYAGTVIYKSLAEISLKALNNGETGELLTNVATYVKNNYYIVSESANQFNEYTISNINTTKYSFSNLSDLYTEFINDWNNATGATLTVSSTSASFATSFGSGVSQTDTKLDSTDNVVKFFDGTNLYKWGWLMQYFSTYGGTHPKIQANAILNANRTSTNKLYYLSHLAYSVYNFFNTTSETGGYAPNNFANESAYSNVTWPKAEDLASAYLVKVGDVITVPAATSKTGYNFIKYNDGNADYQPSDSYTITGAKALKSVFSPINYEIKYYDGSTELTTIADTYTIENSKNLAASAGSKEGYVFVGWHTDSELTSSLVTSIPAGTTGTKVYYAEWVEAAPVELTASSADVAALNSLTPDIIVKSELASGKYYFTGAGLDEAYSSKYYIIGTNAYTTISAALASASNNDKIYIMPGTYSEELTISKSGITLYGPNYGVAGTALRNTEAIITGLVTISTNDVTVNGLKFDGSGVIYATTTSNTTITNNLLTSTPANKLSGYDSRYAQICGSNVTNLVVTNNYFNTPVSATQRGAIVCGTAKGITVNGNKISNNLDAVKSLEVIMIYTLTGVANIRNNLIDAITSGYSIRIYATTATEINIINNTITGKSDILNSSGIQIRNMTSSATVNIVGNDFEHVTGGTLNLTGSSASSTVNVKFNYFQYSYKCAAYGNATVNFESNYYESTQTTATSDVGTVADKVALVTAYKASPLFATYGSVCVYEN